ncbi:ABC transporter permease subunit [Pseudogracilibacillus sp. ICA-222130]|uniref:ABC transporter permease subunit n=1 Tax=Pseudogracilibacillus sp. ICA-222130 TaxID=3134655 RepID=UPI0030BCA22E
MDYSLDYYMKKTKTGKIRLKSGDKSEKTMQITLFILTILTFVSILFFDLTGFEFKTAIVETMHNLKAMFLMPALSHFTFVEGLFQVTQTIGLAVLSTIIGALIAFFLSLLAATNISKPFVSKIVRVMVAFIRAVPTVLWVLIFAISAGLGSEAAVLGMMFHSIAYLVKAYSEAIEEIDAGIIESLRASGANYWHIVKHGILPSISTYLLSWTFLRFEINFGVAVAMGAAAGAGGIGFELFMASGFYYDLREVGFITYMILVIAILLEMYSSKLKGKYLQASS